MAYTSWMTPEQEFEALRDWSETEVCRFLASKVRRARVETRESQEALAERARVPLSTYKRFERDGKGTVETFIQILRAIGRTQYLMLLFRGPLLAKPPVTLEEKVRHVKTRALLQKARESNEPISRIVSRLDASEDGE